MPQKKNNSYRLVILILLLLLFLLLFKNYKDNKRADELQSSLKQESYLTQTQLTEMLKKYDSVLVMYNSVDESLSQISEQNSKKEASQIQYVNPTNLKQVSYQIETIKDSISKLTERLRVLEKFKITAKKTAVSDIAKPQISSHLVVSNIQARGVKFLKDNTLSSDKKDIEQIRVCFTIDKNDLVDKGDKEIFVQIVNPKNQIISVEKLKFEYNNVILNYSKKVKFFYGQQTTDVCSYVDLEKSKIFKGRYIINIYSGVDKIGTTIFNYN